MSSGDARMRIGLLTRLSAAVALFAGTLLAFPAPAHATFAVFDIGVGVSRVQPAPPSNDIVFYLNFACSSLDSSCMNVHIDIPVPTGQPGNIPLTISGPYTDSTGLHYFNPNYIAGTSAQVEFTITAPPSTPKGTTVTVVATATGSNTATMTKTAVARVGAVRRYTPPADFDGDGKTDVAVFRPSTGVWYISLSGGGTTVVNWGSPGDIPVAGDYDGDGKTDLAVFRPSTGTWYVKLTGGGTRIVNWGASGDIPVAGDFNADGLADLAVFRPSTGVWYTNISGYGGVNPINWGSSGDIPVAGDYDGDRRTDFAVFRPSSGVWYINRGNTNTAVDWGASGDIPV